MRTTSKPVIEALRIHILEQFAEAAEYENDHKEPDQAIIRPIDCLKKQVDYMRHHNRSIYQTALDWVEGGSALIYYEEVKSFLNDLGINPDGKEYSDEKSWRLYCHLIAREISKLYSEVA